MSEMMDHPIRATVTKAKTLVFFVPYLPTNHSDPSTPNVELIFLFSSHLLINIPQTFIWTHTQRRPSIQSQSSPLLLDGHAPTDCEDTTRLIVLFGCRLCSSVPRFTHIPTRGSESLIWLSHHLLHYYCCVHWGMNDRMVFFWTRWWMVGHDDQTNQPNR